ncbi:S26 family signal peptidase [Vitiosangium sp. GDMCC 1.1324]|uniref:S26 family signal peptidase n=1 Tax=Vitiosangium sp. (strain GDMCC 1.1324) TaxID=2138576 RepID=UPI000D391523|nr:S26 family signal peptidase [Vitiosangium sp. GDMCC 1.1324]PTL75549.1 S26 family signal peptidase [Vitiosangium sp. GDMCC 1.1324]
MSWVLGLAVVLLAAGFAFALHARRRWMVVTVEGNSMSPTLHHGQRLLARRVRRGSEGDAGFSRSDIVVFVLPPEKVLAEDKLVHRVKRVAAVAGDAVPEWARPALAADEHSRVPPGKVVVSGDNARSQDSRQLGYIDAGTIIAVVRG